jgi:hypothetical protein
LRMSTASSTVGTSSSEAAELSSGDIAKLNVSLDG